MLKHKAVVFGRVSEGVKKFFAKMAKKHGSVGKYLTQKAVDDGYKAVKKDW